MMDKGIGFYLLFVSVLVFLTIHGYRIGVRLLPLASVPVYVYWMTHRLLGQIPVTLDVIGGAASFRLLIWFGIFADGMILFTIVPSFFYVIAHRTDLRQGRWSCKLSQTMFCVVLGFDRFRPAAGIFERIQYN